MSFQDNHPASRTATGDALGGTVVFVLKGYPRLSETFIAQEILALEQRGLAIAIVSLRHPTDNARHPVHDEIRAPVNYLPEYLHQEPLRVLRAWLQVRRRPGYAQARRSWLRDLKRDRTRNRLRRFGQALVLAAELPADTASLHAHFLHTPASVTRYTAEICALQWSASAHARDIWTSPEWDKREKLALCSWLVTCTAFNHRHLSGLATRADTVELVYHGLDFHRFPAPSDRPQHPPVRLLCVGRAVEKKGLDDLLTALSMLNPSLDWALVHVGGGVLLTSLQKQAEALGLSGRVTWLGPLPQRQVLEAYRDAHLFVLPCRVGPDGDRDGLPNVLLEAQSQGLACISTRVSGIPELIEDGVTGLLVEQRNPAALAVAITRLIDDHRLRHDLGQAGMDRVRAQFSHQRGIDQLARRFGLATVAQAAVGR